MVHRAGEQDASEGESGAEEVVAGKETGGVLRVGQRDVDKDTLHHDEDGGTINGDANGRCDPMDGRGCCPSEDEEADGGAEGGGESGYETVLLDREAEFLDTGYHVEGKVGDVDGDAEEAGDEDAEEDEADFADGHAVIYWVHEGENLEERVVDAVDDGSVDLDEEDGRVLDCDLEGLDEGVNNDSRGLEVALVDFGLGHEAVVARQLAETLSAAEEDVGRRGLGEEEEHDEEDGGRGPKDLPERPAPAHGGDGKA